MAAKRKRYPFLFYGVNPSAWFDPEAGAFAYELCFREPPPPGARPKLADALRQALRGRAEASAPWRWAGGRWALARLRPASDGPDGARAAFAAADAALREVHALAPLEHAALLDALDLGDDPWDAWTLEAQPAPAPGPRWPHPITLSPGASRPDWPIERGPDEGDDANDGPAAAGDDDESSDEDGEDDDRGSGDEDDDESDDEDGDGEENDDAGAGDDESDDGSDDESDEAADGGGDAAEAGGGESDESVIAPGRVTFAPLGRAPRPKRGGAPKPPAAFGEGKVVGTTPAGLVYGWSKRQKRQFAFAWLEGDTLRTAELVARYPGTDVAIRPDGRAALVCPPGEAALWVVSFDDGSARKVWKHPDGDDYFVEIVWAGDDRVAAIDYGSLYVVALEGEAGRLEKRVGGASPDGLRPALGGKVLLISDTDGEAGLTVVGVGPSGVKLLARFEGEFDGVEVDDDGRAIATRGDGRRYEVRGLEEAHRAAFEGGAAEFVDAPDYQEPEGEDLSSPPAPGRPGLLRRRGDDAPAPPALPENVDELFGDASNVLPTSTGLAFGFVRKPRRPPSFAVFEHGTLRPVALTHSRYGVTMAARPDGGAALTTGPESHSISEVLFADGEVRRLASGLDFHPEAIAYLGDERVAVVGSDSLFLYRRAADKLEPTARLGVEGSRLFSALGGRVLVVSAWQDPSLKVFGVEGDELRLLAGFAPEIEALFEQKNGRVYVKPEAGHDVYELVGLDEAHRLAFSTRDEATYPLLGPYVEASDDASDDESSDDAGDDASDDDEPPKPRGWHAVEAAGKVGLRYLEGFQPPAPPSMPKDVGKLFGGAGNADFYKGVAYGWKKEAKRTFRFAAWRDGAFAETSFTATSPSTSIMALREDGGAALAALAGDRELWEVDLRTGQARHLWTVEDEDDELYSVDFLADGHHVALGTDSSYVLGPAEKGSRVLARIGVNAANVLAAPDGRTFLLEGVGEDGLWVIALQGGALKTLAHFPEAGPNELREDGGRLLVELEDGGWYELTGVEDARRAAFESGAAFEPPPPYVAEKDDDEDGDEDGDEDDDSSDDGDEDEDD